MGFVQSLVLLVSLPPGSQAIDWVVTDPRLWSCVPGIRSPDPGVHPPKVSGVGAQAANRGARPPRSFEPVRPCSGVADLDAH